MKSALNVFVSRIKTVINVIEEIQVMRDFIFILLFGKTTVLTPQPIDLLQETKIAIGENLDVITAGANLDIDITSFLKNKKIESLVDNREKIESLLPRGTFSVFLKYGDKTHKLEKRSYSKSNGKTYLTFHSASLSKKFIFNEVEVITKVPIENVYVQWNNFSN